MASYCGNTVGDAAFASDDFACRTANGGYSFFIISGSPSAAQIVQICNVSACLTEIAAIRKAQSTECVVHNKLQLYRDILDPIDAGCPKKSSSITAAPSAATPSPAAAVRSTGGTNVGLIVGSTGGVIVVALVIGFFVVRARRKSSARYQQEGYEYHSSASKIDGEQHELSFAGVVAPSDSRQPRGSGGTQTQNHIATPYRNSANLSTDETAASSGLSRPAQFTGYSGYTGQRAVDPAAIPLLNDSEILRARIDYDAVQFTTFIDNGAYGSVHAGMYQGNGVAIKKLRASHASDVTAISKFMEEAKLMASLTHPRIVTFVGVAWTKPEDVCVVMEYMAGGDLRTLLQQFDTESKPMGFDKVKLQIALDVAEALTYLHARWPVVIHRDLKSNNILLGDRGDAKVTDFGVSREHADDNMTMKVGTQRWMAPEVIQGQDYDEKADVFSFGVVLSELDTNKIPYATHEISGMTPLAMMQSVAKGQLTVEFSYSSDPRIVALGRECVSIDPRTRPSMDDARRRIQAML